MQMALVGLGRSNAGTARLESIARNSSPPMERAAPVFPKIWVFRPLTRTQPKTDRPSRLGAAELLILLVNEIVRHAGNVVANHAGQWLLLSFLLIIVRKSTGPFHPIREQTADHDLRVIFFFRQRGAEVQLVVEEGLGRTPFFLDLGTERRQPLRVVAHVFERADLR